MIGVEMNKQSQGSDRGLTPLNAFDIRQATATANLSCVIRMEVNTHALSFNSLEAAFNPTYDI